MSLFSILAIAVTHFIVLIVPGPDIFLILRTSLAYGFKQSAFACLGVGAGIILWIILTAFGLKALFVAFPSLRLILTAFSAAYLFYLCAVLLISARKGGDVNLSAKPECKVCAAKFFALGFLTNISNPKAVLYFTGIFSNFIRSSDNTAQIALLTAIIGAESVAAFLLLGKIFSAKKARETFLKNRRALDAVCSVVFGIFACAILYGSASEILSEF